MSHFLSPFDYDSGCSETRLGLPVILSTAFHILAAWLVLFALPNLLTQRVVKSDGNDPLEGPPPIVEIVGAQGRPVPPVGQAQEKIEANRLTDAKALPSSPHFMRDIPEQNEVVPRGDLADKVAETYRDLTRTTKQAPTITPPPVFDLDAQIGERLAMVGSRVQAKQADPLAEKADNPGTVLGKSDDSLTTPTDGIDIDPEKSAYYAQVKDKIEGNWPVRRDVEVKTKGQVWKALVWITIEPDGYISRIEFRQSTGDSYYDHSLQTAIRNSNPLPTPPPIFGGRAFVTGLEFDPNQIQKMR